MVCGKNKLIISKFRQHSLFIKSLLLLPSEAAALSKSKIMTMSTFHYIWWLFSPGPAASGLTQNAGASSADDNSLGMAEDSGDPDI